MASITALVGPETSHASTLRLTPSWAPSSGKMKIRPIMMSMPNRSSRASGRYVRQQTNGNAAAIEKRQHVEHGKDHVEADCIHKILKEPSIYTTRQKADKVRH